MKREGECFTQVGQRMMDDPTMMDFTLVAVHGLPTGTGGHAEKVGQYPHAWLELKGAGLVYDTVAEVLVPKHLYLEIGNIDYSITYTQEQMRRMMHEHETYGPWDQKLIDRDNEIDKMIKEAG